MSTHKALVLETKQGKQVVKDQPTPEPGKGDVLVRAESVALNPVDQIIASAGIFVEKYPTILGVDGAGVIETVGEGVQKYKPGDRVFFKGEIGNPPSSTFQQKVVVPADLIAKIPDQWSFDQAATLPLAALTAAVGLYDVFKLPLPNEGTAAQAGQWILVTGGSGSVGQLVIQLAKKSGLKVIATSSPHNFPLLKHLGADVTLDRSSPTYVSEVRSLTSENLTLAYDASGKEAIQATQSLSSSSPSKLVLVLPPPKGLEDAKKGKQVESTTIFAGGYDESQRGLSARVWRLLEGQRFQREGKVSGFKFVARPQETK
ncbi:hypothetical protein HK097_007232 [Rhizophlyctis rosea]|uniref:Enoyl reductase (ER) domain-containing protein n=1 Tax=Rhizophlyctis rosea TaxID=64517 RepID=A0AAD5X5C3_9FUNG|nr:hypothetical protein HK097_007232 [Rhizophlyctis rosea]